jgi:hypothetical protein
MPQDRVKTVARARERIDDADSTVAERPRDDLRNITSNLISEWIFYSPETSARQNTYAEFVPLLRRHAVKMHVVGIIEAVMPVLLNFP